MSERTGGGKSHGRLVKIRQIPSFPDKRFMSIIKIILKILNHEKSCEQLIMFQQLIMSFWSVVPKSFVG
jgi:hypothetical protein